MSAFEHEELLQTFLADVLARKFEFWFATNRRVTPTKVAD
jgi:hypothetical protein